ncbi:MAG TPA: metallophosphoesterase family protein [Longimicrobiales bacterium]
MNSPAAPVRLGLISDTHGLLRPSVFDRLQGVLRILHAGDVGREDILRELEVIAPVTAVYGNTDGWELRRRLPQVAQVEEAGRRITVVHGDVPGSPTPARLAAAHGQADIIVYGHTHQARVERVGRTLVVNPGAAGPARFKLGPSLAILTLEGDEERVELLEL